ncbi:MAG: response regulator [Ignavibacteriales bacterium]|nr:response regulator [Ignavibacteriales bacterium]
MAKTPKILVVDDERIFRESLLAWFEEDGYDVDAADCGEDGLKLFEKGKYDVILLDMKMPGMSGIELLAKIKEIEPEAIVIMITAFASVQTAIKALKDGAFDYITKPVDPDELAHLVDKALRQKTLTEENVELKKQLDEIVKPDNLVGDSPEMKKILDLVQTVAATDTTVLVRGESGVGKELVAKAIHLNSERKYFPMVTVNCGALAETLLESELFGHEKGAFTGARHKRKGKFEMADNGTIFLDEIGTVSPKMQVELLRVLESKQFTRVGGNDTVTSNFRVIAATNEPLEDRVKEGKFREDLYYRLNVFNVFIPPLRDRPEDIPALAEFFRHKFASAMNKKIEKISPAAMDFLKSYEWRGNVRELENAIERAVVVGKGDAIEVEDLPFHTRGERADDAENETSLADVEKRHIHKVLLRNEWNISRSAKTLGVDRATLYNKIEKYGLKKPDAQ